MAFCSSCSSPLHADAVFCPHCGAAVGQRPGAATARLTAFVRASGRTKQAGIWIGLGGAAIVLSAFIPWVSVSGLVTVSQSGAAVAYIAIFGAVCVYVGSRVLMGLARRRLQVLLWVLAAIGVANVVTLFNALSGDNLGGIVQPSGGVFAASGGVAAIVVGAILLQTVRLTKPAPAVAAAPAVTRAPDAGATAALGAAAASTLSPDKQFWWDGVSWNRADDSPPPSAQRSPDGRYWWDGDAWRAFPSAQPAARST
jgi:hypothetical protein